MGVCENVHFLRKFPKFRKKKIEKMKNFNVQFYFLKKKIRHFYNFKKS
jgi:hypothetical protein